MKNSNVLLLSAGLSLAVFGVIKVFGQIKIPDPILFGLTIFTLVIALSELADKEKKHLYIFASVPIALFGGLAIFWIGMTGKFLQNFNDAFALFALGVLFTTFAFNDSEEEVPFAFSDSEEEVPLKKRKLRQLSMRKRSLRKRK